jgi:hypothetical protein
MSGNPVVSSAVGLFPSVAAAERLCGRSLKKKPAAWAGLRLLSELAYRQAKSRG